MTGIYIHVPFCAKKCPYCDFYSCSYTRSSAEEYKEAVLRNIKRLPNIAADTIYFGGGTPSVLPPEYLSEILDSLNKYIDLVSPEITIEINPCTITKDKLNAYKAMGINRLSVGVQSADNDELEFLGRTHTFQKAAEIINTAFNMGFDNISCDLMIGVKNQTEKKLESSIKRIAALPIKHISSYILKIEENTLFWKNNIKNMLPDDDYIADLYISSVRSLEEAGFRQYEISNFSKDGFKSRHNLKYWQCEEYIGIGPSAHSYYNGKRYSVPKNLAYFCNKTCQEIIYENCPAGTDEEKIMLGLRLTEGVCPDDFPKRKNDIMKKAEKYCSHGLAVFENNRLHLTPEGFLVSNSIISDII